jgi:hypothetical protein
MIVSPRATGVVAMHGAKGVVVQNCTFRHLGMSAVLADEGSQDISVTHSHFARPLVLFHTRFTKRFGASISETTMRPDRRYSPTRGPRISA